MSTARDPSLNPTPESLAQREVPGFEWGCFDLTTAVGAAAVARHLNDRGIHPEPDQRRDRPSTVQSDAAGATASWRVRSPSTAIQMNGTARKTRCTSPFQPPIAPLP